MKSWWQRRSLRFRLALWHAAATAIVLFAFAWFVYEVIEHRLGAAIDRQLRSDFEVVETQVDLDAEVGTQWNVRGTHGAEPSPTIAASFEVWSKNGRLLLRNVSSPTTSNMNIALPPPDGPLLKFRTLQFGHGWFVRVMEGPGQVEGQNVLIRVFRNQMEMRRTLGEIVKVSTLGFPLAVTLAAIGGYLIATRSLRPLDAMARQARRISSESLSKRLPNPNPHDELGRVATVFNETLARLEGSFAELQRFTADASHELRSPLTALRAVGEIALRDGRDPAALRETIGSMLEEAQRLTDLVEALLTLARMDATKTGAARDQVNIATLIEEVRDQFEVLANEKRQTIAVVSDDDIRLPADRTLLRLALVNLVHNAIRHGPANSQISITAKRNARTIDIAVKDNGPGIPREYQDRIFERFFRIDKARSRAQGGTGLGLAIAKQAVERNGARITLDENSGGGSVFRIQFEPEENFRIS